MKNSILKRTFALVMAAVMIAVMVPTMAITASAAGAEDVPAGMEYMSSKVTPLAPGVTETQYTVLDSNGDRVVYYAITANIATTDTVQVKANYHDNDNTGVWGKATVVEQANAAAAKRGYNVVASTNAAYYTVATGQPTGAFVMEGVNINGDAMGNQYEFFAIMDDGTAMIGKKNTFSQYSEHVVEAVAGHLLLVWDGQVVSGLNNVTKYPRSTVGIKANGDVVLMLADGNQKPYSAGLTFAEQAQIMLELGCVTAIELDGGGSATYAAKPEGTDEIVVRNSCCDGTVRSVSNTIMVISTAVADGTFDHANLSTDYAYYAPYSKAPINALGADKGGHAAEIPENVEWELNDSSYGSIDNGVFTSNGKLGTVTVNMLLDGEIVGATDVTVAHPDKISFQAREKMIPYGKPSDFSIDASLNGTALYADASAYNFICTSGSMNGFVYTAPAEGAGETATVTVGYRYDSTVPTDIINITFGKGSDILFNFENGIDQWGTYFDLAEAAGKGEYTNGYTPIYESVGSASGNLVEYGIHEDVFLASRENGDPVYSGEHSLGYTLDYRYSTAHANWQYAYLYFWGDPITLLDTENGIAGTRLGMWMYIPEEAVGSCARFAYTYKEANGTLNTAYLYLTYMYVEKGFSKLTSDKIPEAGWAYVYVDMKQISDTYVSTSYFQTEDGKNTRPAGAATNYAPAFIQFIISSSASGAEKVTFYIDDITLDYSDAVDDRDMPIISNPIILEDQDSFPIDGRTLNYNTITVTADAAEDTSRGANYTGLDTATAQVYIDGHKVPTKFATGKISATGIVLPNGTHDITFEIADKQGNYTRLTKQIVIAGEGDYPTVTLTGKPVGVNSGGKLYAGGQYNIMVNTDKAEAIDKITFDLWLNSASEWALEHMSVLSGFKASYVLDEKACTATITIERVEEEAAIGEATLLTLPVYAWSWNEELGYNTASYQWNTEGCAPIVTVSYKVKYGDVVYTDGYKVNNNLYVAGFSNVRQDVKTELDSGIANLKKTIGEWHYHTVGEKTSLGVTCTADGYADRVFCTTCASVLEWGTTISATGHDYVVDGGRLACSCGDVYGKFGLVTINENLYYTGNGRLMTGWQYVDGQYYYFDTKSYVACVGGVYTIGGYEYTFNEEGVLTRGSWIIYDDGKGYIFAGARASNEFAEIDGKTYWFNNQGRVVTGTQWLQIALGEQVRLYIIDDEGVVEGHLQYTGIYQFEGEYYYVNDGYANPVGAFEYEGHIYYASTGNGHIKTGRYYVFAKNGNGLITEDGWYEFDEFGRWIPPAKNGFYEVNGIRVCYIDDVLQKGAFQYNGSVYYASTGNGAIKTGKYYVFAKNGNGLITEDGTYYFDEEGRWIPPKKNGFYEVNGIRVCYIEDVLQKGAFEYKGGIYYASTGNGAIKTGKYYVFAKNGNGLITEDGTYNFGEDGKLIPPIKNGFYEVNGVRVCYIEDVLQKGAFQYNGGIYYASSGNGAIRTGLYYVEAKNGNGLINVDGWYEFDETGKLSVKQNGFSTINGIRVCYVNGVMQKGAFVYEGNVYYASSGNGAIKTGMYYVEAKNGNGVITEDGWYEFDEEGKLSVQQNGFSTVNGITVCYIDGVMQKGAFEYEGHIYYASTNNGDVKTGRYNINAKNGNGLINVSGWYDFDEQGRLIGRSVSN